MTVLIINGPNMDILEKRGELYGNISIRDTERALQAFAKTKGVGIEFFVNDCEGEIVKKINHNNANAIIINPGAYSHYSIAILDALSAYDKLKIEVHLTNVHSREEFRQKLVTAKACDAVISGCGVQGYMLALQVVVDKLLKST